MQLVCDNVYDGKTDFGDLSVFYRKNQLPQIVNYLPSPNALPSPSSPPPSLEVLLRYLEILPPHLFSIFPSENTSPIPAIKAKSCYLREKSSFPSLFLFRVSGPYVDYITHDWKLVYVA